MQYFIRHWLGFAVLGALWTWSQTLCRPLRKFRNTHRPVYVVFLDIDRAFDALPDDVTLRPLRHSGVIDIYFRNDLPRKCSWYSEQPRKRVSGGPSWQHDKSHALSP